MSDIFTIKTINLTPMIGMCFKAFRIKNDVTAKSITEHFNRANSYISKFEKGDIKKIDTAFFSDLCNFVSKSDYGLKLFLEEVSKSQDNLDDVTRISIINLDDLFIDYPIPKAFTQQLVKYMDKKNISISQLTQKINSNDDIKTMPGYNDFPPNQWCQPNGTNTEVIKFSIPCDYIESLLQANILSAHRSILEGVLYNLFSLGGMDRPRLAAAKFLFDYNIKRYSEPPMVDVESIKEIRDNLTPDIRRRIEIINSSLKQIASLTTVNNYSERRLKNIQCNLTNDLAFAFAFMSIDLSDMSSCSVEQRQSFLDDIKKLILKYSSEKKTELEIYE